MGAFTAGALVVLVARILGSATTGDVWTLGRSDGLLLGGLVAGELFVLWNNGLRQGVRGHSIGKHREGLRVVRAGEGSPTGAARGLLRGLAAAVLIDLAVAAVPIGLPTVLRSATPDAWHLGFAAYLGLLALLVPLLLGMHRGVLDRVAGTEVVRAHGDDAATSVPRRRALVGRSCGRSCGAGPGSSDPPATASSNIPLDIVYLDIKRLSRPDTLAVHVSRQLAGRQVRRT